LGLADGDADLLAELGVALADGERQQVVHPLLDEGGALEGEHLVGGTEVAGDEQASAGCGAVDGVGPPLQVGPSALFHEAEEVAAEGVDGRGFEDRLDGLGDRLDAPLDLRAQGKPRVTDAQRGEQHVLEVRDRRQQCPDEHLLAVVGQVPARQERQLRRKQSNTHWSSDLVRRTY